MITFDMKQLVGLILIFLLSSSLAHPVSSTYYVSSSEGNDDFDGLTPATAWQSLSKVNALALVPGDSVLFKSGDTFKGRLSIVNESGSADLPVVFSSYGEGSRPIMDGDGYLSSIQIKNSGYIHFLNLEITNERAQSQPGVNEDLRYGIYLENTYSDGTTFDHFRFCNLSFRDIYPTTQITDNDQVGVNAHAITTTGSWGDNSHPSRFRDMHIEHCYFTGIGRHAVVFKAVEGLELRNNLFQHVGGAGIVIGYHCKNVLVEYNVTDHTGSSIDSRMAGRGSGLWCWGSENVVAQYNKFMYARGFKDSYGMHIDHSNRNLVYQYNYSEGNEGGFVEVLGNNVNVGYRYNLSIGDGWRKRGPTYGQIFWFTGWAGDPQNPIPSDSVFVYNNSIYIPDTIQPGILLREGTHCRIYNNIIYASNGFGDVDIQTNPDNIDFDCNLWYGSIPVLDSDGRFYRGINTAVGNPLFTNLVVQDSAGFILQEGSPAIQAGKLIFIMDIAYPYDYYFNHGGVDFYGNPVSETVKPNIGAWNGVVTTAIPVKTSGKDAPGSLFPNPLRAADHLTVRLPATEKAGSASVCVYDNQGRMVLDRTFDEGNELQISAGIFSAGNYILKVRSGNDHYTLRLVVI